MLIKRLRLVKQHTFEELVCEVEVHFFIFLSADLKLRMKLFAAKILVFLSFTCVVHVLEGRRRCRFCPTLSQINTKLAHLQQIDAKLIQVDAKLNQVNATLGRLLAGGGAATSGSGSSSGELTH